LINEEALLFAKYLRHEREIGIIAAAGLIIANSQFIYGLLASAFTLGNTGIVKSPNINVYSESGCINEVSSIDWGSLDPGASRSITVYINNTGNIDLRLSLNTERWNPQNATTYINLAWNYSGALIRPKEAMPITLTLTISSSTKGITNFSFDILIIGTEASG
jgi:uncharacterized membrane protein